MSEVDDKPANADQRAVVRFLEFFAAHIHNPHTRRA